ncbi:MAG: FtsX-like permease family protein [Gammaproteobacteria bacterium]|nr:FtsX-like permease family protein [Gammaproteobacteria bacterium]MDH5802002.1 FtsX-like permease family protein [Gammaproteobacteria bacterium]
MNLSQTAWRNIWRRKRRTLITAFSIGFGVMLAVTFTGTGDYAYTKMIDTGARMGLGHVSIQPPGYQQAPALDKRINGVNKMRQHIMFLSGVNHVDVRIMGQAMFASARKNIGGMFMAIDPRTELPQYNLLLDSLVEGSLFEGVDGQGIVIGQKLAEKLKLKLGKKMVYTTTDVNGEIVSAIARVSGIFRTGVTEVDGAMALLPIDSVRAVLNYAADEATLAAVVISDQRQAEPMRDAIKSKLQNARAEVLSWKQSQPDLAGLIGMDRAGNYISQILIGLLIAAGILNTLLMSVLERTREFGVMMAVGMSPLTLFRLVMVESFYLAVIGLIMGSVITAPWYAYLATVGLDLSGALDGDYVAGGVLIDPLFKIRLFKESVIAILAAVFTLALVSGLYPAWRAGRVPPVESLKTI